MRRAYSAIVTDVVFSAIAAIMLLLSGLAGRPINYSWAEGHTGVTVGLYPLNVQLRWSLSRFCIGNDCEFIDSFPYTSDQEGICYPSPSREHVTAMCARRPLRAQDAPHSKCLFNSIPTSHTEPSHCAGLP